MMNAPPNESAIARWMTGGVTSLTHPVMGYAYKTFLAPLGIEAAWLEAEPFSAIESGLGSWWLREPRWNPSLLDKRLGNADDFAFLLQNLAHIQVEVEPQGAFSIRPASEACWPAVRHSLRAGHDTGAFILMAAGLVLVDGASAALFAAGDDDAFLARVLERLDGSASRVLL